MTAQINFIPGVQKEIKQQECVNKKITNTTKLDMQNLLFFGNNLPYMLKD